MRTRSGLCCLLLMQALLGCAGDGASKPDSGRDDDAGDGERASDGGTASDAQTDTQSDGDASDDGADTDGSVAARPPRDGGDRDADSDELADASTRDAGGDAGQTPTDPPYRRPDFRLRTIASGYTHACAIDIEGALYCWGENGFGQLGVGDGEMRATPTQVGEHDDWSAVTAGRFHTCAIRQGLLYCFGANGFAQLAIADTEVEVQETPAQVTEPERTWTAVSAGDWHTCALDDEGAVYCWGYDLLGRLGIGKGLGTIDDPGEVIAMPTRVDEGAQYVAIDAGAAHTCGVRDDGELWCWGLGDRGQLGVTPSDACELNTALMPCNVSPVRVGEADDWSAVSAGGAHTCALSTDDHLFCFGDNAFGQLGSDGEQQATAPVELAGKYTAVSAGTNHTCAVRANERLACFGSNEADQLGLDTEMTATPRNVDTDATFRDVSSSAFCTCAVGIYDAGFCWGTCAYTDQSTPAQVVTM